jgi:DNA-directed RNA polymerase subunit H (RpoH/RPB5)
MLDKNMVEAVKEFCKKIIDKCARKYGFDAQEAFDYLKIDDMSLKENKKGKKEKKEKKPVALKPRFNLPFCGTKIDGYCCGLKYNARLFTQCMNEPIIHGLCKACNKEKEKTPNLELITKRIEMGDDFEDHLGRKPMHYSVYMEKNRLSKEEVIEEGAKFGIIVDENHLNKIVKEKKTKKAGRPQKKATIVEVNEIEEEEVEETVEEEKEVEELKKKYYLKDISLLPEISRFDPLALVLLLRPGQVIKMNKTSVTAMSCESYRVCL